MHLLRKAISGTSFSSQVFLTFVTQIFIALANIVILRILAYNTTEESIGIYLIVRRVVALTFPVVTMNMGLAMARYISLIPEKAKELFLLSFASLTAICMFIFFIFQISPLAAAYASSLVFGSAQYTNFLYTTLLFLYANSLHLLCIGYFRGKQQFKVMNWMNVSFWLLGILVLVSAFYFVQEDLKLIRVYFLFYAVVSMIISLLLWYQANKRTEHRCSWSHIAAVWTNKEVRNFITYGVKRIPSGFFLGAVFFLPVFFATRYFSLHIAAYIGLMISVVRMLQMLAFPLNVVLLPKFSTLQAEQQQSMVQDRSGIILEFVFTFPLLIGPLIALFSPEIVYLWFGERYRLIIPFLAFLLMFTGFFLGYVIIRGVLDGTSDYPYANLVTLWSALSVCAFFFATRIIELELGGLTFSFGIGIIMLGITSFGYLIREQNLKWFSPSILKAIGWNIVIASWVTVLLYMLQSEEILLSILIKLVFVFCVLAITILLYRRWHLGWIKGLQ